MTPALAPQRARTFYNLADALVPPAADRPGAGDVDLVPAVEARLAALPASERRRAVRALAALEWEPRLTLRSRRGFSWLPPEARRAVLRRWEQSRLPARRRAFALLATLVRETFAARHSAPGA